MTIKSNPIQGLMQNLAAEKILAAELYYNSNGGRLGHKNFVGFSVKKKSGGSL